MQACTVGRPLQWELCTVLVVHAARASMGPTHLACRWVGFEVAQNVASLPHSYRAAAVLKRQTCILGLEGENAEGMLSITPRPGRLLLYLPLQRFLLLYEQLELTLSPDHAHRARALWFRYLRPRPHL